MCDCNIGNKGKSTLVRFITNHGNEGYICETCKTIFYIDETKKNMLYKVTIKKEDNKTNKQSRKEFLDSLNEMDLW
jgi:hypothetical protein